MRSWLWLFIVACTQSSDEKWYLYSVLCTAPDPVESCTEMMQYHILDNCLDAIAAEPPRENQDEYWACKLQKGDEKPIFIRP